MIDLPTINIPVEATQVTKAVSETNSLERTVKRLIDSLDRGKITSGQYNAELGRQAKNLVSLGYTYNQANSQVRKFAASQMAANKSADLSKTVSQYKSLRSAIDPLYSSSMKYADGLEKIQAAEKAQIITSSEAARSAEMLAQKYLASGNSMRVTSTKMLGGWKLNRIGMLEFQAAGINTFQALASGMGPMRVAVMEGSQVIGAFVQGGLIGMDALKTAFKALTSPIGLVTTGLVALAGLTWYLMFDKGGASAKKAAEDLKYFNKQIKNIDASLKKYEDTQKALAMGMTTSQMYLSEQLKKEKDSLEKDQKDLAKIVTSVSGSGLSGMFLTDPKISLQKKVAEDKKKILELQQKIDDTELKSLRSMRQKNDLLMVETWFGKNTVMYQRTKLALDIQDLVQKNRLKGISDSVTKQEIEQLKKQQDFQDKLSTTVNIANTLKDSFKGITKSLSDLVNGINSLKLSVVQKEAEAAALKGGLSKAQAKMQGSLAVDSYKANPAMNSDIPAVRNAAMAAFRREQDLLQRQANAQDIINKYSHHKKTTQALDPVQKLKEQIQQQKELNKTAYAQVSVEEQVNSVMLKLGKNSKGYTRDYVKGLIEQKNQLDLVKKKYDSWVKSQKDIANTIKNTMTNSFMNIVDGTSSVTSAFRTMASDIIKELYKVLVVQQLVGSFNATTGKGKGIVGAVMTAFRSFDGGGYTGIGSRAGGVDGKGGFPAILHPNETVIDHTKGQSSSKGTQVTQHFVFNMAANGDASVKQIIAESVPKITQAAKSAVVDSMRRGDGQMRTAFR